MISFKFVISNEYKEEKYVHLQVCIIIKVLNS